MVKDALVSIIINLKVLFNCELNRQLLLIAKLVEDDERKSTILIRWQYTRGDGNGEQHAELPAW